MGGCTCSKFAKFIREWIFLQPREYEQVLDGTREPYSPGTVQLTDQRLRYQQQTYPGAVGDGEERGNGAGLRKTMSKEILSSKTGFFSSYSLFEEIGTGSTSKVFRAVRKSDGTSWACKVIEKSQARGEAYQHLLQQFAEEVKVLEMLKHPNIIKLADSFETADRIYLCMELMSGGELFDYVIEKGTLSEDEASTIVRSLCSAVAYMHQQNIIHRDIKPENLLLASKGQQFQVKIIDFGLAKVIPDAGSAVSFLGTKGYLAPEMLQRARYGKSIDVWAVGCVVFVLLCGCLPFGNESSIIEDTPDGDAVSAAKRRFALRFPSWASNLSDSAKDLLQRLLDVDPKTRITAEDACKHPWVVGRTVVPNNNLASAGNLYSQRDILRMSPQSLHDAVKREAREMKTQARDRERAQLF